jgi:D-proline reductase (dithiol) PrdB
VSVLARTFEEAGMSTVLVTIMPFWSERLGIPRTVGVEFPFGHTLGQPGDRNTQMAVIHSALALLEEAKEPGEVRELDNVWPQDLDEAKRDWQPEEPSPIIRMLRERAAARRQEGS